MTKYRILPIFLAAATLGPAFAGAGRIPIWQQTTITAPGHYIVTRDFSYLAGDGISIQSDDVTVDLNGHTITAQSATCPGSVIRVDASVPRKGVVIVNGRLSGGCEGVLSSGSGRVRISMERIEVTGSADGILIQAAESVDMLQCYIHNTRFRGVMVTGFNGLFHGRFIGNTIEHTGTVGLSLRYLRNGEVRGNIVRDYGALTPNEAGIYLGDGSGLGAGGNLVENNTVSSLPGGDDDDGISIDYSGNDLVVGNVASRNGRYGILMNTQGVRLERNVASFNGSHGIQIGIQGLGELSHLEGNQAQGNTAPGSCGINFSNGDSHVFRNNNVRGNSTAGYCGGTLGSNLDAGGNLQ